MVTGGEARCGGRQTLGLNFTWFLYLFSRYFLGTGCIRCLVLETQQCVKRCGQCPEGLICYCPTHPP